MGTFHLYYKVFKHQLVCVDLPKEFTPQRITCTTKRNLQQFSCFQLGTLKVVVRLGFFQNYSHQLDIVLMRALIVYSYSIQEHFNWCG